MTSSALMMVLLVLVFLSPEASRAQGSDRPGGRGGGGGGKPSGCDGEASLDACKSQGESCASNYFVEFPGMTYDSATGKFAGEIVTNQCRYYESASDTRHTPDCCAQVLGQTTEFPSRGRVAWSIKGQNIYGPFEAGFGSLGTTLENSDLTKNTKPPHPCYNKEKNRYYGYCAPGVDVYSCEESLHVQCPEEDILFDLFLDTCGGHATPYHHHNELYCYYDHDAPGHSPLVGIAFDGHGIYGLYEDSNKTLPKDLDACNGHTHKVPANGQAAGYAGFTGGPAVPESEVYHYHTTSDFPFTIGCYGPKNAKECGEADKECGDDYVSVEVKDPSAGDGLAVIVHPAGAANSMYDTYCSCRYTKSGTGSVGSNALVRPCGVGTDVVCPIPVTRAAGTRMTVRVVTSILLLIGASWGASAI